MLSSKKNITSFPPFGLNVTTIISVNMYKFIMINPTKKVISGSFLGGYLQNFSWEPIIALNHLSCTKGWDWHVED